MYDLKGKTALITGATKRIGRSLTIGLAEQGANVIIHYKSSKTEANNLYNEVIKLGRTACLIKSDLADPTSGDHLIEDAIKEMDKLDILINNASIFPEKTLQDQNITDFKDTMVVNAWTPFILCRKFAQKIRHGKIINFLDTRIKGYDFNRFSYYLSKKMLKTITQALALKYAPNITVNAVAPGLILPPDGKGLSYLETLKHTVPLNRYGSTSDITDTVLFLLRNDFITGQVIYIDGGKHLVQTFEGI
jgi:pteridine reductase